MIAILLIGLVLLSASVALALRGAAGATRRPNGLVADVSAYGFAPAATARLERQRRPLGDAVAAVALRIGDRLEQRLGSGRARDVRVLLNSAGYYRTSVARYLGVRALAAGGAPLGALVLAALGGNVGSSTILATLALGGLGWIAPPFVVKRRAAHRISEIDKEVPELVDLLVATVEAGIGFTAALQLNARRVRGPLGDELRLTLREQTMGLTLDEALGNLLERSRESAAMRAFVQAIVQGEKLGVSVGKILRDLAVDMRKRRRQRAEEQAQKAPVKLLFPLVFLVLPAMLIVVMGPAAYAVLHSLHT